jgi:hypothetical protein
MDFAKDFGGRESYLRGSLGPTRPAQRPHTMTSWCGSRRDEPPERMRVSASFHSPDLGDRPDARRYTISTCAPPRPGNPHRPWRAAGSCDGMTGC